MLLLMQTLNSDNNNLSALKLSFRKKTANISAELVRKSIFHLVFAYPETKMRKFVCIKQKIIMLCCKQTAERKPNFILHPMIAVNCPNIFF